MSETARLLLLRPAPQHVDELFALYADPEVWASDPLTRHTRRSQTSRMVDNWLSAWDRDGLGMWVARSVTDHSDFVGIGGCFIRQGVAWNLGFRLVPKRWGEGLAQEISAAAVAAARATRADLPITAYLLDGNARSQRTTEAVGLSRVWRGPDAGNPDPDAVRLLYADRMLTDHQIEVLTMQ